MDKYERLGRKLIHKGVIIDYYQDQVKIPDGKIETWDFIGHRGAAAVIPVMDDGSIIMVRQYRNALDRFTLEIPAGGLKSADEPTSEAAARELREETGYNAGSIEKLLSIRTTVAFCNEHIDIYLARELRSGKQDLDEDEFLNVETHSLSELVKMVTDQQIEDSKTICAIMTYAYSLKK